MRKNDPYRDNKKLRRAKKLSVATSTTSGLLGIGALGALGASRAPHLVNPALRTHKRVLQAQKIGQDATLPLTATSLGVGGVGSLNFAAVQNREANRIKTKRNVRKSMDTPMMDFGLSGVHQGRSVLLDEEVSKKDWKNISEHQRGARNARRTKRYGGTAAGWGGAAVLAGTGAAAARGHSAGAQAVRAAKLSTRAGKQFVGGVKIARGAGANPAVGRAQQNLALKNLKNWTVMENPYGSDVLGGGGLMGGGLATTGAGAAKERYHENAIARQRKARVTKAYTPYDPEARRKRRLDGYATGLAATAGAAGGGAGVYGAQARQSYRAGRAAANEYSDLARRTARARPNIDSSPNIGAAKASVRAFNEGQDALASRAKSALETANRSRKAAKVKGGRSAALGAAGVGALVGADQVRRYRNRGGRSWNTRNWDQD